MVMFRLTKRFKHELAKIILWNLTSRARAVSDFKLAVAAWLIRNVWRVNCYPIKTLVLGQMKNIQHSSVIGINFSKALRNTFRFPK